MPGSLHARNISKSYAAVQVLDRVSLVVSPGDRIGIVGPNGIGKSTLLRVLAGLEQPDGGDLVCTGAVGYLPQEPESRPGETVLAYLGRRTGVGGAEAELDTLAARLESEPALAVDYSEALDRFLALGGDDFDGRARAALTDVGLAGREQHEVASLSGGEAARDRARAQHQREYAGYMSERDRYSSLLADRRGEARAGGALADRRGTNALRGKVRQAKNHLERLQEVDKPWAPWQLRLELPTAARSGERVVELTGAVVDVGSFRLGPLSLELRWGDRLAVVGANGSGKTTLIRALLGELPLGSGSRRAGASVVFGELSQARDRFAGVLLDDFVELSGLEPTVARTLLAKFALGADDVGRPAPALSPGERTRAGLALLAAKGVNCLVLDEPTNHLDLEAIEELETALETYDGCLVVVTHDRRFLERLSVTRTIGL